MKQRIICPNHEEVTPSCVLYTDRYHCFGCGKGGPLSDLEGVKVEVIKESPKEDIQSSVERIRQLPVEVVRGIPLHCDADYFYILWPRGDYYTKRRKDTNSYGQKYLCPAGHSRPLFVPRQGRRGLLIIEGELNALSASQVVDNWTICSPGGTGTFDKHLTYYKNFDKIVVIADKDVAGCIAVIGIVAHLRKFTAVTYYLVEKDFNDILTSDGKEYLRRQLKEDMGVY